MGVVITNLGQIDNLVTRHKGGVVAQKSQHLWTGGISPAARIAADKSLAGPIERALDPTVLADYFIPCTMGSPTRCIDGRITEGYDQDMTLRGRPLGPQVPGGTAISALTRRIVHATDITEAISFSDDLETTIRTLKQKGLSFGGHIDNADHPHGDTGCGAIDRVPEVLACIANPRAQRQIRGITKLLLGIRYDDAYVDAILGRIINLESIAERYFMIDPKTGVYDYKQKIIADLRKNNDTGVARLAGPHYEVGLAVNTVPGTTFDGDRFSSDNANRIQLFNYDFWLTQHVAELSYPTNHHVTFATAKLNLRLQHEYILCRTLLAVAVAMVLTDGSIQLIIRK